MMNVAVRDEDTDSLSTLPLAILPFGSVTLRGLLMVKNIHCESVVQMFRDNRAGSGHVHPDKLKQTIHEISRADMDIVTKVGKLHSFDVYCLRISLRDLGIEVNDTKHLKLSKSMQAELDKYVRPFTARLTRSIFGDDSDEAANTDVGQLLKNADPAKALDNLKLIAQKIQIDLNKVPLFLEDYGDIYLSIAYYRNILDQLEPKIENFTMAMDIITKHQQLKTNADVVATAKRMTARVEKMQDVLRGRFHLFTQSTNEMWNDMNADKFADFKKMVEDNHGAIGGILCKLDNKMDAWHQKFPSRDSAGPNRCADFLMADMRQGF